MLIYLSRENEPLAFPNSGNLVSDPLPLFGVSYAIRPPPVHARKKATRIECPVFTLFIQYVQYKSSVQSLQPEL